MNKLLVVGFDNLIKDVQNVPILLAYKTDSVCSSSTNATTSLAYFLLNHSANLCAVSDNRFFNKVKHLQLSAHQNYRTIIFTCHVTCDSSKPSGFSLYMQRTSGMIYVVSLHASSGSVNLIYSLLTVKQVWNYPSASK